MKMRLYRSRELPAFLPFVAVCVIAMTVFAGDDAKNPDSGDWKAPARAGKTPNPIAADEKSVSAGKNVYINQCACCHGAAGNGDGPAAKDLTPSPGVLSAPQMWEQTDGELFWKITQGRKPMPCFGNKLSKEQRWDVVNYVRTLAPRPTSGPQTAASG